MSVCKSSEKIAFEYHRIPETHKKEVKQKKEKKHFFSRWHRKPKKPKKSFWDDIVSVVVLETTQLYKSKTNWGVTFGDSLFDGDIIAMSGGQVPNGTRITFSITYKDGSKKIVKEYSGSDRCDRLLQMAYDAESNWELEPVQQIADAFTLDQKQNSDAEEKTSVAGESGQPETMVQVGKNQLPYGKYLIGKDIPAGYYDFTAVWGDGSIRLFPDAQSFHRYESTNVIFYENIGKDSPYFARQVFHVECCEGQLLYINGNQIVEISRSKPLELDL